MSDKENQLISSSFSSKKLASPLDPKFKAAILGATGSVGQRFVSLLADHPWIEIAVLAASEKSAKQLYKNACEWRLPDTPMPLQLANIEVLDTVRDARTIIETW